MRLGNVVKIMRGVLGLSLSRSQRCDCLEIPTKALQSRGAVIERGRTGTLTRHR